MAETTRVIYTCDVVSGDYEKCERDAHSNCGFCGIDICGEHIGAELKFKRTTRQVDNSIQVCENCSWESYNHYGLEGR